MNWAPKPSTVVEILDLLGDVEKLPVRKIYQPLAAHIMQKSAMTARSKGDWMYCGFIWSTVADNRSAKQNSAELVDYQLNTN